MTKGIPPVSRILRAKGIPHDVFVHKTPPNSLEQAAKERGQLPTQIVRSILFRKPKNLYVMVLMAGSRQINWKSLRKFCGTNRITMAKKEEVWNITGYQLGAVAPFGFTHPIDILIDFSVIRQKIVSLGSGVRGTAIILNSSDLIKALDKFDLGDFSSTPQVGTQSPKE